VILAATAPAEAAGPEIELAPDVDSATTPTTEPPDVVTRGMRSQRFASETPIGGYGELHLNVDLTDSDDPEATADLHRLVLFLAHSFSADLELYVEAEVEHTLVGDGKPGEVGIEQAYIDYRVLAEGGPIGELALRTGIVLVPMGILNQWHEPPIFHGVERTAVDKSVIPTTWREAAVGLVGRPTGSVRYEAYLMTGLDAGSFRASDGIRKGRQAVAKARTDGVAFAARVEVEPSVAYVVGASAYAGRAGGNLSGAFTSAGAPADLDVWVTGYALDARGRWAGLEARAVLASFSIGETAELRKLVDDQGDSLGIDVGSRLTGAYAEVAYDVFATLDTAHQLLPFVRLEYVNTLAELDGRDRSDADDNRRFMELVAGLSWRPHPQVVFKGDLHRRTFRGDAEPMTLLDLGVGFML